MRMVNEGKTGVGVRAMDGVILSEAKDPLPIESVARNQGILRCAQDDTPQASPIAERAR